MLNLIVSAFYYEDQTKDLLVSSLTNIIEDLEGEPVFLCIGSERHILDCLGPLIGTMLLEKSPDILAYGTLDKPLHAKNLVKEMENIKENHSTIIEIAIDAAVGLEKEIGMIKFRHGHLLPGKALAKNLPPVGDFSITGIIAKREYGRGRSHFSGSFNHVYHMAKVISQAISEWHEQYKEM